MHIFAGRSIGHKPLHFWHHFLQKHFTHLVLLILHRSFFLKLKLFSLRHNRQDSKFDTFLSCWFGIGRPTVGVPKKPVHAKYFSTSCLNSDHKCLSNELTNSKRRKRSWYSQVQWGCHEKREKLRSTFFCLPAEVTSVGQSVGFGRDHFYLSRQHCTADHQRLTSSRQKLSPLKRKSKDNFLWQISCWYLSIHYQIEI